MSKKNINLDLSLAPPNSSHLQSSPAVQESPGESLQESLDGRQLQLPSPAVQESLEFTLIEVPYRRSQVLPFYNFFGPKNGDNTRIQEPPSPLPYFQASRMGEETINLELSLAPPQHLSHSRSLQESRQESLQQSRQESLQLQLPPPSVQESVSRRQLQLLSLAVQESIEFTLIEVPYRGSQIPFYNFFGPKNGDNTRIQETPSPLSPPQKRDLETQKEITPLYPWAKSTGFEVHSLKYLVSKNITKISGEMMCMKCKKMQILEYNLKEKFALVCEFIKENSLKRRGLGRCGGCGMCSLKPVISEKKEEINWLFLMLGQMIGWCSINQIRYFCQKNGEQRYFVKDRLVDIATGVICNQLDPTLSFEF